MTIQIQAPDGSMVEFPDGMSDDQISAAMAKEYGASAPIAQSPQQPANWRQQLMGGPVGQFMSGAMQPIYGADELFYKGLQGAASLGGNYPNAISNFLGGRANAIANDAELANQVNDEARKLAGGSGINVPKIAGTVASPINTAVSGINFASPLVTALARGAAYSSLTPQSNPDHDYWSREGIDAGIGTGTGGILHGGSRLASALVDPSGTYGRNVATLTRAGVPLTVGQIVGGPVRTIEDSLTSIPIVGDVVKSRQRDALRGLNQAVLNRALAPIGVQLPAGIVGHDAVSYAQQHLGDAYDAILPRLNATADPQLAQDMSGIVNNAARDYGLNDAGQQHLYDILHGQIVQKAPGGVYDGATLKDIQSNLRYQAQNYSKSQNPDHKNLADALYDARDAFNDFIARQNPADAQELRTINSGYANLARGESAAAASKTGIFTPFELNRAVKSGGTRAQNASGRSLMQDLSAAGIDILPQTVPDSGTAGRHAVELGAGLLAGAGAEHVAPGLGVGTAITGGGLALGGSRLAQTLARGALMARPYSDQTATTLANALARGTPAIARAAIPLIPAAVNPAPE